MATDFSALTFNEEALQIIADTAVETVPKSIKIDGNSTTSTQTTENADQSSESTENKTTKEVSALGKRKNGEHNASKLKENNGVLRCVGRSNRAVTWGAFTHQGRRHTMEDDVRIFPGLMQLSFNEVGGCTAPECKYLAEKSPVHYFGVFDGHGGDQNKLLFKDMHELLEQIKKLRDAMYTLHTRME